MTYCKNFEKLGGVKVSTPSYFYLNFNYLKFRNIKTTSNVFQNPVYSRWNHFLHKHIGNVYCYWCFQ